MDDILIRGGQVIDGTGAPARVADVAIRAAASSPSRRTGPTAPIGFAFDG
jgi:hypothetical protein